MADGAALIRPTLSKGVIQFIIWSVYVVPLLFGMFIGLSQSWTGTFIDSGMVTIPLYLFFVFIVFIICVVPISFSGVFKRWWTRLLFVVSFLLGIPSLPVMGFIVGIFPADYIHLLLMYPSYETKITSRPDGANTEMKFSWASTGFGGIGESDGELVYDPTDKLNAQRGIRPSPCDCVKGAVSPATIATDHLFRHFYVVRINYD